MSIKDGTTLSVGILAKSLTWPALKAMSRAGVEVPGLAAVNNRRTV